MKQLGFVLIAVSMMFLVSATQAEESSQGQDKAPNESKKPEQKKEKEKVEVENPVVKMITNRGEIIVELDAKNAPITVENFLSYVQEDFYNGTIFHRVIKDFMIQGGGFTSDMQKKETKAPIKNESDNGLRNNRGTIAMARTNNPDSATSQFFINHKDNHFLNAGKGKPGYAVFGKVIEGMDVVDGIAEVTTRQLGSHGNVPTEPVSIESVEVIDLPKPVEHQEEDENHEHDHDHND
jgi:peptidyl-prolyl cis-trans isomerase A (cyclophilin A)